MHELVEIFMRGMRMDGAALAAELGYFDKTHLINDFRITSWLSPAKYQENIGE